MLHLMWLVMSMACVGGCGNMEIEPEGQPDEGSITLQLRGSNNTQDTRATTSTITEEEARLFLVSLYKGTDIVNRQVMLGDFVNLTFPVGYGYKVFVENITDQDAETFNDGWGAKRYTGLSKSFGIQAGQTTKVTVGCSVANAAIAVNIADGVGNCTVNIISGERTLSTTTSNTAYFNIGESGIIKVSVQVAKDGEVVATKDLELSAAQVKDINIKPGGLEEANADIVVNYDDSFDIVEAELSLPSIE